MVIKKGRKKTNTSNEEILVEKTEWQKRHEVFLERQKARKEAEQKRLEDEAAKKKEELEQFIQERDSEDISDETEPELSSEGEDVEEKVVKQKLPKIFSKKSEAAIEAKRAKRPARIALTKALSVIVTALLILLVSVFIISPLSRQKYFSVTGVVNADQNEVMSATGIRTSDYISEVFFNRAKYEAAVAKKIPWVKSANIKYVFPNRFTIDVTENRVIAYAQRGENYRPVLENGVRMPVVTAEQLPAAFLTVNLTKEKDVQTLVKKLAVLDPELVSEIHVVNPIPKAATKDLISLEMKTGHQVRVPLSQIDIKLPYYLKLKDALVESSIIDMEVGVYSTTEAIEALIAEEMPQREADAKVRREEEKKLEEERRKAEEEAELDASATEVEEISTSSESSLTEEVTDPANLTDETGLSIETSQSSETGLLAE